MALFDKSKLTEEELKEAGGGYIFETDDGYEVIDDNTGEVLRSGLKYIQAVSYCNNWGVGTRILNWQQLNKLRETGSID